MSDWGMYELEDVRWEEFSSDDCIVPHRDDEHVLESICYGDSHKKQWHGVCPAVSRTNDEHGTLQKADKIADVSPLVDGESPLVVSSWSNACADLFPSSSDPQSINEVSALVSQGSVISDNCLTDCKADANGNLFSSNEPTVEDMGVSDVSKICQISLADISPEDKELHFLQYGKDGENNVPSDDEWDDIGNFENVDRMFRSYATTFGQGSIGSADELSWFSSSSHMIDACEDTFNFGCQFSDPELSALNKLLKPSEIDMSFFLQNDSLIEACDHSCSSLGYCANANWLDTDVEDSCQMKLPKSQHHARERIKNRLSEIKNCFYVHDYGSKESFEKGKNLSSDSSSLQPYLPPLIGHKNPLPRAESFKYSHSYDYHVKMENSHLLQSGSCVESEIESTISPSYEVSVHISNHDQQSLRSSVNTLSRPPTMTSKDTIDKICCKKELHALLDIEKTSEDFISQAASSNQVLLQNKSSTLDEVKVNTELTEISIECPKCEIDYSTFQANSMISVLSDDIVLGSASFNELQDVLDQLDIRTKLCIRDGLYRLARNAEMRLCIDDTNHNRGGNANLREITRLEESKQSSEFVVETGTNPIDRTIAHILFYRASNSSTRPINYAVSQESHMTGWKAVAEMGLLVGDSVQWTFVAVVVSECVGDLPTSYFCCF